MNKEHFLNEIEDIDFPKDEVFAAIETGIAKGKRKKDRRKKTGFKIATYSSVAAAAFLISGLIFAPINNVLASVPVLGSIYEKYGLQIGAELEKGQFITQLNKKATSSGIDITITSAYYDGNVIGITFQANGEKISLDRIEDKGPETGYSFHLFDGNEQKQWSSSMTSLKKTKEGYVAAIEFYNPKGALHKNETLPITFSSITGVKGNWKFVVPIEQIQNETIHTPATSRYKDYTLKVESIIKGKATTLLNYSITSPSIWKDDEILLTVFDNEGNRLAKNSADLLSTKQKNSIVNQNFRELFSTKISDQTKFLMIEPEIRRNEEDTVQSLEQRTPFIIKSSRFDYKIQVNSIKQARNQLILDYNLQNVNPKTIKNDIIKNFVEFIHLIKSEDIDKDKNGKLDMEKILELRIRNKQTNVIDKESMHYQSVFSINDSSQDYSIIVPFGTLSRNEPIKMKPLKIDLENK
ncbi:DUF4179 domain-containing protein [Heyndrickxia sporothermodurans]